MAMVKGQALVNPVTGLAGRIFNELITNPDSGLAPSAVTEGTAARKSLAAMCQAIATAVIDEIVDNAVVTGSDVD